MRSSIAVISPRAWDLKTWRVPPRRGLVQVEALGMMYVYTPPGNPVALAAAGTYDATLHNETVRLQHGVPRFSRAVIFSIFASFLLPLWRTLGKTRWVVQARTLPKTIGVIVGMRLLLTLVWNVAF